MLLHQALADLARDHGHGLFRDASAFRGSLDDYLDEGQASSGTINLLTDAVRLGAVDGMLTMLDSGARPADAVDSAGQRLARDRGSADVRGCQWAVAVLGFALGKVPEDLVTGLDPDAATAAPPFQSPPQPFNSPVQSPIVSPQQPIQSPVQQPVQSPVRPPQQQQQPIQSPAHAVHQQSGGQGYGGGGQSSYSPAGWSPQPKKKSNTGFILGAVAAGVAVIIVGIIVIVALANSGGDDPSPSTKTSQTPEVPDLGGPVIEGNGYKVQGAKGWTDGTQELIDSDLGGPTLDRALLWGDTLNTSRGSIIIETQSSYGSTDPNDLKDDWKEALTTSDPTAEVSDIPNISIDGSTALGVEIQRTNDSGVRLKQRSHLMISGDKGYSITVTFKEEDDEVLAKFEEILTTWQWNE